MHISEGHDPKDKILLDDMMEHTSPRHEKFDVEGELRAIACVRASYAWVLTREKLLLISKCGTIAHRTEVGFSKTNAIAATANGDVYVYDAIQKCVLFVSFRGEKKKVEINNIPSAMCCRRDGDFFIAFCNIIVQYSNDGKRLCQLKVHFGHVCKIAENRVNDSLCVADHDSEVVILSEEFEVMSVYRGPGDNRLVFVDVSYLYFNIFATVISSKSMSYSSVNLD